MTLKDYSVYMPQDSRKLSDTHQFDHQRNKFQFQWASGSHEGSFVCQSGYLEETQVGKCVRPTRWDARICSAWGTIRIWKWSAMFSALSGAHYPKLRRNRLDRGYSPLNQRRTKNYEFRAFETTVETVTLLELDGLLLPKLSLTPKQLLQWQSQLLCINADVAKTNHHFKSFAQAIKRKSCWKVMAPLDDAETVYTVICKLSSPYYSMDLSTK